MRVILLVLATSILAACNNAEAPAESDINLWVDVAADAINVPEGVAYTTATRGDATVADIANVPDNATASGQTGGVSVRLPDAFEAQASGHQVSITVRAATASETSAVLGVAYSTNEVGNSGWQRFTLSAEPRDYVFVYDVQVMQTGKGDFLGFRSYGSGHVQILGFRTEVLGPVPPPLQAAPGAEAGDSDLRP